MEFIETTIEKARAIARNLRMDPELQETITNILKKLDEGKAWEIVLSAEERPKRNAIKGQIERIAILNQISVAVRTSGTDKLVCWKLTDQEIEERKKRGEMLRAGRQKLQEKEEAAASRRRK